MKKLLLLLPIITITGCSMRGYPVDPSLTPEQESNLISVSYPTGLGKLFIKEVNGQELPERVVANRSVLALPKGEVELTYTCQLNAANDFGAEMKYMLDQKVKFTIEAGDTYFITPVVHGDIVAKRTPNRLTVEPCKENIRQCVGEDSGLVLTRSSCLPAVYNYDSGDKVYLDLKNTTKKN